MKQDLRHFIAAAVILSLGLSGVAVVVAGMDRAKAEARSFLVAARAAAFVYGQEQTVDEVDEGATQAFFEALPPQVSGLEGALVLRKTKIKAHSDPSREGTNLSRDSLSDKAIYDAGRQMKSDVAKNLEEREKSPDLKFEPYPESRLVRKKGVLTVQVPSKVDGDYEALVQLEGTPTPAPRGFPWGLLVAMVLSIAMYAGARRAVSGGALVAVGNVLLLGSALYGGFSVLPNWRGDARATDGDAEVSLVGGLLEAGLDEVTPPEQRSELLYQLGLDPRGRSLPVLSDLGSDGAPTLNAEFAEAQTKGDTMAAIKWAIPIGLLAMLLFTLGFMGLTGRAWIELVSHRRAYAYLAPAMVGLGVLVFIPVTYGIVLGFMNRVYNDFQFAGLANYVGILSDTNIAAPTNFYFTLGVTIMWTVLNVFLHVSIGLFLALLLNDEMLKARGVYRVLLIVPWAVPNYITALIWKQMFHNEFGAINFFLAGVGLEPISWFQTFWPAFFTNLATNTWLGFPFMMVVSLGALQSIPTDLYEAAYVDGASRWQRFKNITLPLLMPALVPAVIVGTVWTFNMFNIIYLVSGGAPNGATDILITEAFRWAFERDSYGYAAAYSTIIFVILVVFTVTTNRLTGATKGAFE
ncbi:MAG: sugar ABC transporter permease [Myxococcota bacterium]